MESKKITDNKPVKIYFSRRFYFVNFILFILLIISSIMMENYLAAFLAFTSALFCATGFFDREL